MPPATDEDEAAALPAPVISSPGGPPPTELTTLTAQIAAWVADLPALPDDAGHRYGVRRLVAAWNLEKAQKSAHTAKAHRRDLSVFLHWCQAERLDPLTARPTDIAQYKVWRTLQGSGAKTARPATVARALASLSSFYRYLLGNADHDVVTRNPLEHTDRPAVPARSTTAGLTSTDLDRILHQAGAETEQRRAAAQQHPSSRAQLLYLAALRDLALLVLLADTGLRIDEALARDLTDLSYNAGHRTLQFVGKGGQPRERPLPPQTREPLEQYLHVRAAAAGVRRDHLTGPLFATNVAGTGRLSEVWVFRTIRRLAKTAGVPADDRLSPHSLRHYFATVTQHEHGLPLQDVQDAMGHADPRTTRRYDRDRDNLDRDPAYVLAAARTARRTGLRRPAPLPAAVGTFLAALRHADPQDPGVRALLRTAQHALDRMLTTAPASPGAAAATGSGPQPLTEPVDAELQAVLAGLPQDSRPGPPSVAHYDQLLTRATPHAAPDPEPGGAAPDRRPPLGKEHP